MNDKITAAMLLKGSRNIDQMKKDIRELVSLLASLMKPFVSVATEIDRCYQAKHGKWNVVIDRFEGEQYFHVRYIIMSVDPAVAFDWRDNHNNKADTGIRAVYVQPMHEDLDILVEGIIQTFPAILSGLTWRSIVRAADVKFPNS